MQSTKNTAEQHERASAAPPFEAFKTGFQAIETMGYRRAEETIDETARLMKAYVAYVERLNKSLFDLSATLAGSWSR